MMQGFNGYVFQNKFGHSRLESMATGIFKRFFPRLRFLQISKESSHFNKVFEDIIDELTAADSHHTEVFIGLHVASGTRCFFGYLYSGKDYGACLWIQYDGAIKVQFLNNGDITTKSLG